MRNGVSWLQLIQRVFDEVSLKKMEIYGENGIRQRDERVERRRKC